MIKEKFLDASLSVKDTPGNGEIKVQGLIAGLSEAVNRSQQFLSDLQTRERTARELLKKMGVQSGSDLAHRAEAQPAAQILQEILLGQELAEWKGKGFQSLIPKAEDLRGRFAAQAEALRSGFPPGDPAVLEFALTQLQQTAAAIDDRGLDNWKRDPQWLFMDSARSTPNPPSSIKNSLGMEFVYIPPGEFLMGPPKGESGRGWFEGQHLVIVTKGFYLGKFPVTQEEYENVLKEGKCVMWRKPSYFSSTGGGSAQVKGLDTRRFPVESVSKEDAEAFCHILSKRETGKRYRLPTEAEWEYACRAGMVTPFAFGTALNGQDANCNGSRPYGTSISGPHLNRTSEVGSYGANLWGLHDLHGNVWEWCQVLYTARGGSWASPAKHCRSACRGRRWTESRGNDTGFRVVLELGS